LLSGVALLVASFAAIADDLDGAFLFDIHAQTLDQALLQFGAQTHVQISFASRSTKALARPTKLTGSHTGRQALAELLRGSSLKFIVHGNTVEILPGTAAPSVLPGTSTKQPNSIPKEIEPEHNASAEPDTPLDGSGDEASDRTLALTEIVITGSRLRPASKYGSQEVQVYDQAKILESGQTSIADFLATLPSVSVASPEIQNADFATTVRLRGLPVGTTLVLLNGRRVEGSGTVGGAFFDLSTIPLSAVQSIEVDQSGSSAIYGSDGIGGVVNIILKKDFSGFEVSTKYGWAKDTRTTQTTLSAGKQWGQGGFSVIATYDTDGGLLTSNRLLSSSNNYQNFGGPDNNYPDCFLGNVFSITGEPLPGAPAGSGATYAALVGPAASGKPALSQFSYDALNQCSLIAGSTLLPSTRREGVLVEGHLELGAALTVFTELMYTHQDRRGSGGYEDLFGTQAFQEYDISPANPYNPFGTTVGVAEALPDVPEFAPIEIDFFRPLVGLKGSLGKNWQWEASVWQSTDWGTDTITAAFPNYGAIQDALNSADPNVALDPFGVGPVASPTLLSSLFGNEQTKGMGRDQSAEVFLRGPLLVLPGGPIQGVVGGDYDRSELYSSISGGTGSFAGVNNTATYRRRYYAMFGEARIPIIARPQGSQHPLLAATISGRHDHYSDFGGATTAQFGVEAWPTDGVLLRGTHATAFQAPSLPLLYGPRTTFDTLITDPKSGSSMLVPTVEGGNLNLQPMKGRSHTFGVVYVNGYVPALTLSATQWTVVANNIAQSLNPQVIVSNEAAFPGRVVRDASGNIKEVFDTEANFGSIDVSGLDYQIQYDLQSSGSTWSIDLNITETYHYSQALVPGAQPIESVAQAEDDANWSPRWKGTAGVNWTNGVLSASFDGRYTGAYRDYDSTSRIGNYWAVDAYSRVSIGRWLPMGTEKLFGSSYIEAGATNLFNRAPQFSNYLSDFYGYDAAQSSIVGRSLYVDVGLKW
jgi:iron complex outermembrane receptor protein